MKNKQRVAFALLCLSSLAACSSPISSSSSGSSSSSTSSGAMDSSPSSSSTSSQASSSSSSSNSSSSSSSSKSSSSSSSSSSQAGGGHTAEEWATYKASLASSSLANHLYSHYMRYENTAASYAPWDIWAWSYKPKAGEGYKFDWKGRTTSEDKLSASGDAIVDAFGGATVDIDLSATYDGGWNYHSTQIGGTTVKYAEDGVVSTQIGFQIVKSSTRSGSSFWTNDGSNIYVTMADYSLTNSDSSTSYHIFAGQDDVQNYKSIDECSSGAPSTDPFANDDGTNVTYGLSKYNDVDWTTSKAVQATSPAFLKGTDGGATGTSLKYGAGVGYQIMVASFADSDGDGFGDIYGVDQKLDYLKDLGVNVIWLTPIQLSDSYHGYDISDYTQVDPKFGSTQSPAGKKAGSVSSSSAMEDYKQLITDAHSKGMAVIMDLVINHTSTSNDWFINSAKLNETYRGYYQWGNHDTDSSNIKEEKYWYPYGDHVYSYYAKFGSSMPELNYAYTSTRAAVASMAKNWCQVGVDGFRMDAVKHIFLNDEVKASSTDTIISDVSAAGDYSSNLTKNLNFWRELSYEVKKDYPNAFSVGENFDGTAYKVAPFYEGFDSMFDFYSYFNITSSARYALDGQIGGAIQAYDGLYSGSSFDATSGITNASTSIK